MCGLLPFLVLDGQRNSNDVGPFRLLLKHRSFVYANAEIA